MPARRAVIFAIATIIVLAGVLALDIIRFERETRPADVRAAYQLAINAAVNFSDFQIVRTGGTPKTVFDKRGSDSMTVLSWARGHLERSGRCLNESEGQNLDACKAADRITLRKARAVISPKKDEGEGLSAGVSANPLKEGETETFGAIFSVDGQIGIGRDFSSASRFKIDIEGRGLEYTYDASADGEDGCIDHSVARAAAPLVFAALPGTPVRPCTYESKDRRRLTLLQIQYGPLQWSRRFHTLQCRALLKTVINAADAPDFAGCLSANWNDSEAPVATLILFQSRGAGEWAVIR